MRRWLPAVVAGVLLLVGGTAYVTARLDDAPGRHDRMMTYARQPGIGAPGSFHGLGRMHRPGARHVAVSTERDWLAEMVAHHEEAIASATQLSRSRRPEMRDFGRSIVETQSAQVRQMRRWLAEWYGDRAPRASYRPMMRDLAGLAGDALDRTFLINMVRHHMMAVMLSQQLLVHGLAEHGDVTRLARGIRDEQRDEILRMRAWLREWFR
jgi:uncharacterized protein (DUF305 family)